MAETLRQRVLQRLGALRTEYATWEGHYRELGEHILPRRFRFRNDEPNRGDKLNDSIINDTPLIAARILHSGLMAGITSPSKKWFRVSTPDPELAEFGPARAWLHVVQERILWAMARSNFYQGLADGVYPDLGVAGTACAIIDEHPRFITRTSPQTIGQYYLATS